MEKVKQFIDKWGVLTLLVFSLFLFMQNCAQRSRVNSIKKDVKTLTESAETRDSVWRHEFGVMQDIQSAEILRDFIYEETAIDRGKADPDARMKHYIEDIDSLRARL